MTGRELSIARDMGKARNQERIRHFAGRNVVIGRSGYSLEGYLSVTEFPAQATKDSMAN